MINDELKHICNKLNWKKITDKQAIYIFNNVIAPAIEYRIMIISINATTISKWNSMIANIIQKKTNLPSIFPSAVLRHPDIYNLLDIEELQAKLKISELLIWLNSTNSVSIITIIRLANL